MNDLPGVTTNFSQVIQDNVEEALSGAKGEVVAGASRVRPILMTARLP